MKINTVLLLIFIFFSISSCSIYSPPTSLDGITLYTKDGKEIKLEWCGGYKWFFKEKIIVMDNTGKTNIEWRYMEK